MSKSARSVIPLLIFVRRAPLAAAVSLALSAIAAPALAQDPPTRAGRIAWVAGPVSLAPAGADTWMQAPLNQPLVAGDRLWTDAGARDEAQFGPVSARMDAGTLMSVLAADEGATQLQLSQGRIDLHVRRIDPNATVEVDTPNIAFVARAPGDYRIVVSPDGASTDVAVLRGAGDVYGDGNAYAIPAGQGYRFGGQDLQNLGAVPVQPYDEFDRWAMARDARLERAQSARFVPADLVGYEDLDDNGAWRTVPDYGTVWVPTRVAADWAPYHSGHWTWVDPWGWTWVDDQPWGYAVSHYGRWVNLDSRWAWVPAPMRERPVYAPALVAFVGAALALGGRNDGPGVGWFPLGPREPYRPYYQASPAYVTHINVANTYFGRGGPGDIIGHPDRVRYANRGVPGALMAMPTAQFAGSAPAHRFGRGLDPRMAMNAPLMANPGVRPLPQSRFGTALARALPPQGAQHRIAVARSMPGHPGGAAFAHGAGPDGRPDFGPGARTPVRMLRPAAAVRAGVPPPHGGGAPQFAGRPGLGHGGAPAMAAGMAAGPGRAAGLAPASAPYPNHGHGPGADEGRWAGVHGGPGAAPTRPGQGFAGPAVQAAAAHEHAARGPGAQYRSPAGASTPSMAGPAPQTASGRGAGAHEAPRQQEHHEAPRPQEHHEAPRQQEHHEAPRQQEHHEAPRQQEHHEAPRQQEHHDSPRPPEHHDAPPQQQQQQQQQHHEAPQQQHGGDHHGDHGHGH